MAAPRRADVKAHIRNPDLADATREIRFHPADPARARTLSAAQVLHYNERGYVPRLDVFSADEAKKVRDYISELIYSVVDAPDRRNSYSINTYHLVCVGLYDLAVEPRILDYVRDILGPNIVCWGTHVFAKMPSDGKAVPFHQDAAYWPLTPTKSVTVWLAIDNVDAANAAMELRAGSHLHGELEHEQLSLDGTRVLGRQVVDADRFPDVYVNELRAGQASLHSDLLLHGSAPNVSDRRRAGLTLRYASADVRLVDGFDHWAKVSVHCLDGDPDHFWSNRRRPDGEHPEFMAEVWGEFDGQPIDAG